jgi:dTDP-4-dehydrorhamnose 3,5-epimerase
MQYTKLTIPSLFLLEPKTYFDNRGEFFESFNHAEFEKNVGSKFNFVQDNQSCSKKWVLRGLHYQLAPKTQGKLVRVLSGEIFDVAVDIRKNSPTFGTWVGVYLSAKNKKQIWIPQGFAHGFLALADTTIVLYKVTDYYEPSLEKTLLWNDPDIGIEWNLPKIENIIVSQKDTLGLALKDTPYL